MAKSPDVQIDPRRQQQAQSGHPSAALRPTSREPASETERRRRNERAQELRQKNRARSMRRR